MTKPAIALPRELYTGLTGMDEQHEDLFQEIQAAKAALMSEDGHPQQAEKPLLEALIRHMAEHFAWEEQQASDIGLSFAAHAEEHRRIIDLMREKFDQLDSGSINAAALMVFLDRRFEMHVSNYDRELSADLLSARK